MHLATLKSPRYLRAISTVQPTCYRSPFRSQGYANALAEKLNLCLPFLTGFLMTRLPDKISS